MSKNRDDIPGMQKLHKITNPTTGAEQEITQQEWKDGPWRQEGWVRVEEVEGEVSPEAPAEGQLPPEGAA